MKPHRINHVKITTAINVTAYALIDYITGIMCAVKNIKCYIKRRVKR